VKLGFIAWQEDNAELALLLFNKGGAGDEDFGPVAGRVSQGERAAAADLNAIVEIGAGSNRVSAKAGAGIVDFDESNSGAGAVFNGDVDVMRVAGGQAEDGGG